MAEREAERQHRGQLDRGGGEAGGDEPAARDRRREQHVEAAAFGRAGEAAGDRADRQVADRERHDQAQHLGVQVLLDARQLGDAEGLLERRG